MEKSPHCTVSPPRGRFDPLWILLLTAATLLVHGYHPWAEDGGLYVAGIEYNLDPSLFPHETAFVTEHLPYSIFTQVIAAFVRISHCSLAVVLFATYLLSTALTLYAALRVARRCFASGHAQWIATSLLAAWWTLPIAGTSLFLMDPYVTARSLSTPLSLLAVSAAIERWSVPVHSNLSSRISALRCSPAVLCICSLAAAAAFHPLMGIYSLGLILLLRHQLERRPPWLLVLAAGLVLLLAATMQSLAHPEAPAVIAAAHTRYYWFLAQWHWFEWMGLVGPLAIFASILRWPPACVSLRALAVCRAAVFYGCFALCITLIFAQEHFRAHPIARLQPLRVFLLLYALMILLIGGVLADTAARMASRGKAGIVRTLVRSSPALFVAFMALLMFFVQRETFPASIHVELPERRNRNPWVEAFLWARDHTPKNALFALDARYVNTQGEDAQTFRAISLRDALPDFSKDGGEAANIPSLAPAWWKAAQATRDLSQLPDRERDGNLLPFDVGWLVLHADAVTSHSCPYRNAVVKICTLP